MKEIFRERDVSYNLRYGYDAKLPKVRTTSYGVESIGYLGNKVWQLLLHENKTSTSLRVFKNTSDLEILINATAGYAK